MSSKTEPAHGPPRILIVEDDEDQRLLLADAVNTHYGASESKSTVAVATGAECLAQHVEEFDVVLLDFHLPDMSGMEVMERIRARVDIPIIFVTGENTFSIAAEAIKRGAQDYIVKLGDYLFAIPIVIDKNIRQHHIEMENRRLETELQSMVSELRVKNIQLSESMTQLRTMADTDHLTGLTNRRKFSEELDHRFDEARRYGFDLTCCMCDLDHYKLLNDTLGHQVGDQALIVAADIIRASLRSSDVAGRYGGDEFVLLLSHTSVDRAAAVCDRIREELAEEIATVCGAAQAVTMSVGIASIGTDNPTNANGLVAMADQALYVAKARGKDQIVLASSVDDLASAFDV